MISKYLISFSLDFRSWKGYEKPYESFWYVKRYFKISVYGEEARARKSNPGGGHSLPGNEFDLC